MHGSRPLYDAPLVLLEQESQGRFTTDIKTSDIHRIEFVLEREDGSWDVRITQHGRGRRNNFITLNQPQVIYLVNARGRDRYIWSQGNTHDRLTVDDDDYHATYEQEIYQTGGRNIRFGRITLPVEYLPMFKNVLRECEYVMTYMQ